MAETLTPGTTLKNGLVAESDFIYEAPENAPDFDLKSAEKNFIDSLLAGQDPSEIEVEAPADESQESPFSDEEPAEVETEEPAAAPVETEDEDDIEDPKLSRGIQRVVARELAAKAEREAAEKAIAQLTALKAEMAQYSGLKPAKELADQMDVDPLGVFKVMGKDPDTIIKLALAQQLGDKAPDNLKEFARDAATKREIAQLKAQLAQEAQARNAQEYFNTILSGAREYVGKVGDSTPTLALVAKADPDYARDEIMEEIVNEAKRQAATDPNGEPLAYTEAAKRVESRLSKLAKLLNVQNGTPANKTGTKPKTAPPTTKPAAKPLMPWQTTKSQDEAGIQEALRAYERAEAERKARRY